MKLPRIGVFICVLTVLGLGLGHDAARSSAWSHAHAAPSAGSIDRLARLDYDSMGKAGEDQGEQEQPADESQDSEKKRNVVVVVSKKNPVESIDMRDLSRIFLRQRLHWSNGWAITVFERSTETSIRTEFSLRVFGKTPAELHEYWLNLQLTRGLKAPKVCRSARLVGQYLSRVKGGIGYIYDDEVDDTVKVVPITEDDDG